MTFGPASGHFSADESGCPLSRGRSPFSGCSGKRIAAAERGDFIEEEEMDAHLEAMFKP